MGKETRNFTVTVTKPGSDYVLELKEGSRVISEKTPIRFDKNGDRLRKASHYRLNFTIEHHEVKADDLLRFAPDDDDVMWVHDDIGVCPPSPCYMPDTLWVDKNINGAKLRLINMDLREEEIRFKLNLVKKNDVAARPFVELDPLIKNGNRGGAEPLANLAVSAAVTGAVVGAVTVALTSGGALVTPATLPAIIGGAIAGLIVGAIVDR